MSDGVNILTKENEAIHAEGRLHILSVQHWMRWKKAVSKTHPTRFCTV